MGVCVGFNIVIGHLGRPYSTHTAPIPVLTGFVHAHILTKPYRAGFAAIRLELIEPGAETCVYQAGHALLPISLSGNLKMVWVLI